jgi:hypothetical protein
VINGAGDGAGQAVGGGQADLPGVGRGGAGARGQGEHQVAVMRRMRRDHGAGDPVMGGDRQVATMAMVVLAIAAPRASSALRLS